MVMNGWMDGYDDSGDRGMDVSNTNIERIDGSVMKREIASQ